MTRPVPAIDEDAVVGCLLGQAVGDALGLPMEGLSPRRGGRLYPHLDRHQFFLGRGMGSDDTEHACMTAQALLRSGGDVDRFSRSLAWRLRWWFLSMPAGIGKATLKACVKLWLGFPPTKSGVRSAGNGPAMRAAIIGVCCGDREDLLAAFVRASTRLTHTDPRAELGAAIVAAVARAAADRSRPPDPTAVVTRLMAAVPLELAGSLIVSNTAAIPAALETGLTVAGFAESIGLRRGVSGYIAHTVPVAVYAFFRHPDDYRAAVQAVIRCGGDTDTVAAITGALGGARVGKAGIPAEWLRGFADWPRSAAWIERLGRRLAQGDWRDQLLPAVRLAWWALPARNAVFFLIVLLHVVRRLLPPY